MCLLVMLADREWKPLCHSESP